MPVKAAFCGFNDRPAAQRTLLFASIINLPLLYHHRRLVSACLFNVSLDVGIDIIVCVTSFWTATEGPPQKLWRGAGPVWHQQVRSQHRRRSASYVQPTPRFNRRLIHRSFVIHPSNTRVRSHRTLLVCQPPVSADTFINTPSTAICTIHESWQPFRRRIKLSIFWQDQQSLGKTFTVHRR